MQLFHMHFFHDTALSPFPSLYYLNLNRLQSRYQVLLAHKIENQIFIKSNSEEVSVDRDRRTDLGQRWELEFSSPLSAHKQKAVSFLLCLEAP